MNTGSVIRALLRAALVALFLLTPAVHPDGQLWIVAAASTAAMYWGIRASVVYALLVLLVAAEVLYGGDVGSVSGAFAVTVGVVMLLRRVITIQPWASQEGWRIGDLTRTAGVSWAFSIIVLVVSICIGDVLFGYDHVWMRIQSLMSLQVLGASFIVCLAVSIILRRMTVPFRRAILFGI